MFSKRIERTSIVFFTNRFQLPLYVYVPYMSLQRETQDVVMFAELIKFNSPILIRLNDKTTWFDEIFVYVVYYLPRLHCVSITGNQWFLSGNRPCLSRNRHGLGRIEMKTILPILNLFPSPIEAKCLPFSRQTCQ